MAYKHGVYINEQATSITPAVSVDAGLPVIFGTAPVHLASEPADANKPVLCYEYAEAVAAFGYSKDWENYTLCEAIYTQFALYGYSPVVFVNVLDPDTHIATVEGEEVALSSGTATIDAPILLDTLIVRATSDGDALTVDTDYTAAYNDDEELVISVVEGGALDDDEITTICASYTKLDPSLVDKDDIIGGVDTSTGAYKGLEVLDQVFTKFGLVPSLILAPGWSHYPSVAAVMVSKATNINEHFKAMAITDIPTDTVTNYSDAYAWKEDNGYTSEYQIVCYPKVTLDGSVYHMSTHVLGVLMGVDSDHNDIPYASPSNNSMNIDGLCLDSDTEFELTLDQATYLNGCGIVTAINFMGSWKCWGNNTGIYPTSTDVKDRFISVRRMFNWHEATFICTYWSKVDQPINKRLIQTVCDSENIRLNGLKADGAILGGRIEFLESENDTTDLLDGVLTFHTYITPPVPARVIENTIEYDPDYFSELFN